MLVGVAVLIIAGCRSSIPATTEPQAFYEPSFCLRPTCDEVTVTKGDVNVTVSLSGTFRYVQEANLPFGNSGIVASVDVREGDKVEMGQLLATLATSALELEVINAKISVQRATEAWETYKNQVTPIEALTNAEADIIAAEISIQDAREALRQIRAGPTSREIADAQASLAASKLALQISEDRLAEPKGVENPLVMRGKENQLALANAILIEAQIRLNKLRQGPDAKLVSRRETELDIAEAVLLGAKLALDITKEGRGLNRSVEIKLAEAEVARASLIVSAAKQALELAKSGPSDLQLVEAEAAAIAAEILVEEAVQALELANNGPTARQLAQAEADLANSRLAVEAAQEQLTVLARGVDLLEVKEQENRLVQAQFNLQEAERRLESIKHFPAEQLELLQAELKVAQVVLFNAEVRLNKSAILAPFSGTVRLVNVKEGETVDEDEVIMTLVDTSAFKLVSMANESESGQLEEGQKVVVIIPSLQNAALPAHVVSVTPVGSANSEVTIGFPEAVTGEVFQLVGGRAGLGGEAEVFVEQRADVLFVPVAAVAGESQDPHVELVSEGSTSLVQITPGLSNGSVVEVADGLHEGDVVRVRSSNLGLLPR